MVPSIWLWLYVAATLIARLAIRSAPLLRFLMYLFDIDQHPIRSVGIVAAMLAMVLAMAMTILAITTWAGPSNLDNVSAAPIPPIYQSDHRNLY
jgi:hypothetical protein